MIRGEQKYEPLPFIYGVEEPVIPDAISPGLRYSVPQFLDVLSDVGVLPQLGIHVGGQLALDARLLAAKILLKIFLELRGFKDAKLSQ